MDSTVSNNINSNVDNIKNMFDDPKLESVVTSFSDSLDNGFDNGFDNVGKDIDMPSPTLNNNLYENINMDTAGSNNLNNLVGESNNNSFFSSTAFKILLLVLLLALLGVNLFKSFGDLSQYIVDVFGPPIRRFLIFLGFSLGEVTKQTVAVSAEGSKKGIDILSDTVTGAVDLTKDVIDYTVDGTTDLSKEVVDITKDTVDYTVDKTEDIFDKELQNNNRKQKHRRNRRNNMNKIPEPDDALSRTQSNSKGGYCYIGEDRGFRSCIKVDDANKCLSGDVYPTMNICINPNLRQ